MTNIKELNPDESPQAAFGAKVRSARETRQWRQEDLSERMDVSSTHVSAIETGRRPPTLRFARKADRALECGDKFERLWRDLKHGSLLEGFPEFVMHEGRAAEIRLYEVGVVPGLLQTPEYAAALAEGFVKRGAITEEQAGERVALVAERQTAFDRRLPPLVFAVLDESCLRRPVGSPSVMEEQFARLLEFAELPNTVLQVAPFTMGASRPFNLPVTLLTLPDRSLMAYSEAAQRGYLERESTAVLPILTAYHQLQAAAPSPAESLTLISQLRKGIL
ncbi:helix-turn-helix domain-containing protein [Streptomyces yaizuensis]|uniref:Helix-turn-helix domain-containing protein n=1 Tax=Streptomyces yaizuensis TaxID=2989713 RepID=A0ABQ5NU66_9ACTN|nr:helix-turn-helix transcriptional regulator [Streptomyces sp. YSPA8]GLF93914.1 helix-turn-helix domain-containing protein [Streptomyces sp. YSPA8]